MHPQRVGSPSRGPVPASTLPNSSEPVRNLDQPFHDSVACTVCAHLEDV